MRPCGGELMAEGLNRALLMGNLGADPELRMTNGGNAVLKIRLATSERYLDKDRNRQERTEWHSCIVWGKRAEALAKILTKGSRIFVEGSLRTTSWEDKDGNKRYRTEIVAQNILLQGDGKGGQRSQAAPDTSHPDDAPVEDLGDDDLDGVPF